MQLALGIQNSSRKVVLVRPDCVGQVLPEVLGIYRLASQLANFEQGVDAAFQQSASVGSMLCREIYQTCLPLLRNLSYDGIHAIDVTTNKRYKAPHEEGFLNEAKAFNHEMVLLFWGVCKACAL
jgi:hypothetical protein